LDALVATVPPEMQFSLSQKETAKEAWDAIAAGPIGSDRARKSTLQTLRKEWENLAFKPGEDIDDFTLRLNTLMQKLVQFGDNTYDEERAIEKLFRCVPEKYKQMAHGVKSLIDLSTMTIEEAIGRLKVVDADEPQPPSGPVTISGRLHFAGKQWEVSRGDEEKGSLLPRQETTSAANHAKLGSKLLASQSRHQTTPAATVASLATGPRSVDSHDAARPTSPRQRRSQLCSWHMQASSYLRRRQQ
jgi:hypothetical protein